MTWAVDVLEMRGTISRSKEQRVHSQASDEE